MKKKNFDPQKTDELLQKLQAAVLSQKERKKTDAPDEDEIEFQKKIAGMLNRITPGSEKPSGTSKRSGKVSAESSRGSDSNKEVLLKTETPEETVAEDAKEPLLTEVPEISEETSEKEDAVESVTSGSADSAEVPAPQISVETEKKAPGKKNASAKRSPAKEKAESGAMVDEISSEPEPEIPAIVLAKSAAPASIRKLTEDSANAEDVSAVSAASISTGEKKLPNALKNLTEEPAFPPPVMSGENSLTADSPHTSATHEKETAVREFQRAETAINEDVKPAENAETAERVVERSEPLKAQPKVKTEGQTSETIKPKEKAESGNRSPSPASAKIGQSPALHPPAPVMHDSEKRVPKQSAPVSPVSSGKAGVIAKAHPNETHLKIPTRSTEPMSPRAGSVRAEIPGTQTGTQKTVRTAGSSGTQSAPEILPPISEQRETMQKKEPQQTPPKKAPTAQAPNASQPPKKAAPEASVPHKPTEKGAEPIVIQPAATKPALEPIVIKPRQNGRVAEPAKREPNSSAETHTAHPSEPGKKTVAEPPKVQEKADAKVQVKEPVKAGSTPVSKVSASPSVHSPETAQKEKPSPAEPRTDRTTEHIAVPKSEPVKPVQKPSVSHTGAEKENRSDAPGQTHSAQASASTAPGQSAVREQKWTETSKEPTAEAPAQATPRSRIGGVSLPRPHLSRSASEKQLKEPKKSPSRIHHTPIRTLPEDENLDEALDDIITEESPLEILPVEEPEEISAPKKQSVFARRKEKKAQQAEQALGAISLIEKKTGMTEDDIAMIFELGYENELGRLVGYETLKKLKNEHIRRLRKTDGKLYRTSFGYRNTESQPKETVLANYAHDRKNLTLRLFFTALIMLILIPIDLPALFGSVFDPYRTAYPFLFPLLGVLLLTLAGIASRRQINAGIRSFFRFTPTPYSLIAVLFPIAVFHGILAVFLGHGEMIPANLATVSVLLLTAVCDALRLSNEMHSYRIATTDGDKTVLDPAEPRKKKLRHGDKIVKIINDDVDQNLYRVRKSEQITGFFRRCNDFSSANRPFMILLSTMLALAFIGGLAGAIRSDSFTGALSAFILVLLFAAPASAVLLFFYPLGSANKRLAEHNCTLIGEESVTEYSEPKTVIFNDSDMYAAQKCTQISVREGEDFRQDMRLAGILFRKMSGTLGSVGQNAPMKNSGDPPVAFVRLTENGTEALVDSHYHLLAGNAAFMAKNGVRVPKESTDRSLRRAGNVSLMYVAIDGILKLSYEIEYTVAQSFEQMAAILAEADTVSAIQTYDPNLNEAFLQTSRPGNAEYVRVIKPGRYEQETVQEVVDSGAIALGDTFAIARPIIAASAIRGLRRTGCRLQLAAALLGGVAGVALSLNQSVLIPGVPLLFAILWQVLCLGFTLATSYFSLRGAMKD